MAYNASIADALAMAPQLGTLSTTTRPTLAQGTVIWSGAVSEIQSILLRVGLSTTVTSSSVAEGWLKHVETLLTSGLVLVSKGSTGKDAEATGPDLVKQARALLAQLVDDWSLRMALLGGGASASTGTASPFLSSQWIREKDPEFNETAGTGDIPYAHYPELDEGSDL